MPGSGWRAYAALATTCMANMLGRRDGCPKQTGTGDHQYGEEHTHHSLKDIK